MNGNTRSTPKLFLVRLVNLFVICTALETSAMLRSCEHRPTAESKREAAALSSMLHCACCEHNAAQDLVAAPLMSMQPAEAVSAAYHVSRSWSADGTQPSFLMRCARLATADLAANG